VQATESTCVLLVEDDEHLAQGLVRNLQLEGFDVECVHSGEEALKRLRELERVPDIMVLDIMLPGIDGFEVCRLIRDDKNTMPILFLTALGSDADRLMGLRLGADDYLTKPFLIEELVLRVRGILRRAEWSQAPARTGPVFRFADTTVELEQMRAETGQETVQLTEREVMLLRFFAENEGRVLSRGELLENVWGYTFDTSTRTLDTFIHRLRKLFEHDPHSPCHFHTVRGVGYRFTREPEG